MQRCAAPIIALCIGTFIPFLELFIFMKKRFAFSSLCFFLILIIAILSFNLEEASAAPSTGGKTLVLYDAASGTVPDTPLLNFTDFPPGTAPPTYSNGVTVLDTTLSGRETYAGWRSNGAITPDFPILDRTAGFQVDFTLQVEIESHGNNNRSGFSLIILSEDARGIELAFWENEIWAQSDSNTGGLFKHGEGVTFPTNTDLIEYKLALTGDTYTLTADTQPILSGPVRDYSDFDGFPDPYQTPNFLFLGDDTTSSQARVQLSFLSITGTEPITPTGTSTSSPLPTVSPTSLPSTTPMPSPPPTRQAPAVCPSSGLFLVGMITSNMILISFVKTRSKKHLEMDPKRTTVGKNRLL